MHLLFLMTAIAIFGLVGLFLSAAYAVEGTDRGSSRASTLVAIFLLVGIVGVVGMIWVGSTQTI